MIGLVLVLAALFCDGIYGPYQVRARRPRVCHHKGSPPPSLIKPQGRPAPPRAFPRPPLIRAAPWTAHQGKIKEAAKARGQTLNEFHPMFNMNFYQVHSRPPWLARAPGPPS